MIRSGLCDLSNPVHCIVEDSFTFQQGRDILTNKIRAGDNELLDETRRRFMQFARSYMHIHRYSLGDLMLLPDGLKNLNERFYEITGKILPFQDLVREELEEYDRLLKKCKEEV